MREIYEIWNNRMCVNIWLSQSESERAQGRGTGSTPVCSFSEPFLFALFFPAKTLIFITKMKSIALLCIGTGENT